MAIFLPAALVHIYARSAIFAIVSVTLMCLRVARCYCCRLIHDQEVLPINPTLSTHPTPLYAAQGLEGMNWRQVRRV